MSANQNHKRWVIAGALGCVGVLFLCFASAGFLLLGGNEIFSRVARPPVPAPQPAVAISTQNIGRIEELYRLQVDGPVLTLAWSPDSKLLAVSAGQPGGMLMGPTHAFQLWDVTNGHAVLSISEPGYTQVLFALSPDGHILAYLDNNAVKLWDVVGKRDLRTLVGRGDERLGFLSFSLDGSTLFSVNNDYQLKTWNVATGGKLPVTDQMTRDNLDYLMLSPDYASCRDQHSQDGRVIERSEAVRDNAGRLSLISFVLSDAAGRILRTLEGNFNYSCPALSPDGSLLAYGGTVWDVSGGKQYTMNGSGYMRATFSPDGRFLATGGNGTVQLWGIRS